MAFQTPCFACKKMQTPLLDKTSDCVHCSECDAIIPNISHFFKTQMKTSKQYRQPKRSAYAIKCVACKSEALPKLSNNILTCPSCNTKHANISKPFEVIIREKLSKGDTDL